MSTGCSIASVSRSGYHKWRICADEPDKDYDDYLLIKKIFDKGKAKYGFRTVLMKLSDKGIHMNHKKVSRIMRKYNLITRIRRKNPYKTIMKKSLQHRTFENRLDRKFKQTVPFNVLCTDITYLPYNNRFAYLSVIKDIASGEVVAWNLSQHLEMELVLDTVSFMRETYHSHQLRNAMIHSDQGFHYTNPLYIEMVEELNMVQSMSGKGNCIDNSPIESFFEHWKDEVEYKACKTFIEVREKIEEYMEYYNNGRRQWDLKKMTPVQYRNHLLTLG